MIVLQILVGLALLVVIAQLATSPGDLPLGSAALASIPVMDTPSSLAGVDGGPGAEGDQMPPATTASYSRAPGISNYWLPARVARRLVAKYGFAEATKRITAHREKHIRLNAGIRHVRRPELWLHWTVTREKLGHVPTYVFLPARNVA